MLTMKKNKHNQLDKPMRIAIFGDTHGHLRLMFQLSRLWQLENGVHLDAILQCGDLGFYPNPGRADKATKRFAEQDPEEFGFTYYFRQLQDGDKNDPLMERVLNGSPESLDTVYCPVIWCQGNHEDFNELIHLAGSKPLSPVDRYQRLYWLQPGKEAEIIKQSTGLDVPGFSTCTKITSDECAYVFPTGINPLTKNSFTEINQSNNELLIPLVIGSLGGSQEVTESHGRDEGSQIGLKRVNQRAAGDLSMSDIDVIISHCAPLGIGKEEGSAILRTTIERAQPIYHFYAHHRDPILPAKIDESLCYWLNDVNFQRGHLGLSYRLEPGCMGILTWFNKQEHQFKVVDDPWLMNVSATTWQYL